MSDGYEQLLFGCMVLRADKRINTLFPLDKLGFYEESAHIEGSYFGAVTNGSSTEPQKFFYPQRSRTRRIYSATKEFYLFNDETTVASYFSSLEKDPDGDEPFDQLVEDVVQRRINGPHLLAVDQVGSNASVTLMSRNVELRMYGLHHADYDVLAWTNMVDYSRALQFSGFEGVWVYSFEPIHTVCRILHTRRLCSRWYRWGKDFNHLQRFAALERMVLGRART